MWCALPPASAMPAEIARLPKPLQAMIKQQCRGDWARVTVDANGSVTVHNAPQRASRSKGSTTARKAPAKASAPKAAAPAVAPPPAPTPPRPVPTPTPAPAPPELEVPREPAPQPEPPAVEAVEVVEVVEVVEEPPLSEPDSVPQVDEPERRVHPAELLRRQRASSAPAVKKAVAPPPWDRRRFPRIETHQPPVARVDPGLMRRVELPPALPKGYVGPLRPGGPPSRRSVPRPTPSPPPRQSVVTPPPAPPIAAPLPEPVVQPVVQPVAVPEEEDGRKVRHDEHGRKWILLPGIENGRDWERVENLEASCLTVLHAVQRGLPSAVPMIFHDDVTALHGIDLGMVETACRVPERVEIDPSTGPKKYPVMKFWRGDVMVVVGFREPQMPVIIAAYIGGKNLADTHRTAGAGGGGSRKASGLPRNPTQLIKRLQDLGAICEESTDGKTWAITFDGDDLGKVQTYPGVSKSVVENDFQRMQRRMQAITMRKAKTG